VLEVHAHTVGVQTDPLREFRRTSGPPQLSEQRNRRALVGWESASSGLRTGGWSIIIAIYTRGLGKAKNSEGALGKSDPGVVWFLPALVGKAYVGRS
jgi:hypothetical protein